MGIKSTINSSMLPKRYQQYNLIPTVDGVMATTYLLDDIYVLKLFEPDTQTDVLENEVTLLSRLVDLPIPKVVEQFTIDKKSVIIYTQIQGDSISKPTIEHIEEIAKFLKAFHIQSRNIKICCKDKFQKIELKELIDKSRNISLLNYFHSINLNSKNDGVIHGDLFTDNCKFKAGKISGVYDFSDICMGDFYFDLAVVAVGWCFEDEFLNMKKVKVLLDNYGSTVDSETFISYIKYALLYYATTRFLAGRNYSELLKRLEYLS